MHFSWHWTNTGIFQAEQFNVKRMKLYLDKQIKWFIQKDFRNKSINQVKCQVVHSSIICFSVARYESDTPVVQTCLLKCPGQYIYLRSSNIEQALKWKHPNSESPIIQTNTQKVSTTIGQSILLNQSSIHVKTWQFVQCTLFPGMSDANESWTHISQFVSSKSQ